MRPGDEAELQEAVRGANGPLVIRGGGTRTLGAPDGETLETSGLTGIALYEPGALTLVARAGTPLAEIDAALAAEGQRLTFEVPDLRALLGRDGVSTIGGVAAANASGPRRIQAGACRDALLGVRFVDGAGTLIKNGGRTMKNVTGYDLVRLLAGSRGTLGVLTEVSLRVQAIPEAETTLVAQGLSAEAGVSALTAALGSPYDVTGAAFVDAGAAGGVSRTQVRIEGLAASVAYRAGRLAALLGQGWEMLDGDASAALWREVRDVTPFAGREGPLWRVSVRPTDGPRLLSALSGQIAGAVLDWGGGLAWLRLDGADPQTQAVRRATAGLGGHATLVRGPAEATWPPEADAVAALSRALRAKFDPRGIFGTAVPEVRS